MLFGGPLENGYVFEFIHFHWALQDGEGTEHHFDGLQYELEMHLGHRNNKYRDMAEAGMNHDGILVLAFLFQVSDGADDWPLLAEVANVGTVNSSVVPEDPQNYALANFAGDLIEEIVNIRGSLTTPPCSPANWFFAPQIRTVSRTDVCSLAKTYPTILLRPPLLLNDVLLSSRWTTSAGQPEMDDRSPQISAPYRITRTENVDHIRSGTDDLRGS